MQYYCTYFDINFLPRGLALYSSLKKNSKGFRLYVLALDDKTFDFFKDRKFEEIECISLSEYLNCFSTEKREFLNLKEFYFSITPGWCLFVLNKNPSIDLITYIDADIYFFDSTDFLIEEINGYSIGMAAQPKNKLLGAFWRNHEKYNVGLNIFRNNEIGLECLKNWKVDCDSWRADFPQNKLPYFSDQVYLDDWPEKYGQQVKIFQHKGLNLLPDSLSNGRINKIKDVYWFKNQKVVAFHFMQLYKTGINKWNTNSVMKFFSIKGDVKEMYTEYITLVESFDISQDKFANLQFKENSVRSIIKYALKNTLKLFFKEEIIIKRVS